MSNFEQELRQVFFEEVSSLLDDTEKCFLTLEDNKEDISLIDKIFRLAHNLKGSAKAVGFNELGMFAHEFENLLLKIKNKEIKVNAPVVSLLLRCNDHINLMIETLKNDSAATFDSTGLMNELKNPNLVDDSSPSAPTMDSNVLSLQDHKPPQENNSPGAETPSAEQEQIQHQADSAMESMSHEKLPMKPQKVVDKAASAAAADETIRVSLGRLEKLLNYVGEMVIFQTVLNEQSLNNNPMLLRKTVQQMGKVTKEVQDLAMSLRMIPLKQTFQKMQRIARDTSTLLNKKIQLIVKGEDTEVDKTVLENLGDPLVHIIRNACDHGIESNEARKAAGKSEVGIITLNAYHQGGRLVIEISDDGGGIDPERLTKKAIEKGLVPPGTELSRKDGINLIFHPGFSSKEAVTEISGRGVGMDVVKTNIESLQGEVQVDTFIGKGTTFKIFLPLTLAIIDGMIVMNGQDRFVIPLSHIHESLRISEADIKHTTGLGPILLLRGENLPLFQLSALLGNKVKSLSAQTGKNIEGIAMVVRTGEQPFAILVDDILSQQQVVIKKLGPEIQNLKGFSGSSILGDGRPALILELGELVESMGRSSIKTYEKEMRRMAA